MDILGLAGSLRAASINAALLRAAARLAPYGMRIVPWPSLGTLPPFNADVEPNPPPAVRTLREAVGAADALLIASPEYAHGISGVMKNALDWLVGYEGFVGKPVAVLNASPRAHHAHDALLEVLRTMSARVVGEACVAIPLLGAGLGEDGMVADPAVAGAVRAALMALRARTRPGADGPSSPIV